MLVVLISPICWCALLNCDFFLYMYIFVFVCYSCMAPTFSFKCNKEVSDFDLICTCVCVCVCVYACVRACMRACVFMCVTVGSTSSVNSIQHTHAFLKCKYFEPKLVAILH